METQLSLNGEKYLGDLKEGVRNGYGILLFLTGERYLGEFKNGIYHGYGIHTLPNGEKYIGEFAEGERNGNGTFIYFIGVWWNFTDSIEEKYIGEFKNGLFHGSGTLISSESKYIGEFKNGHCHGNGTLINSNGEYIGEFKDGRAEGNGTLTKENGVKYIGQFKDNCFHGEGTLIRPHINEKYIGQFQNGCAHGKVTLTRNEGTIHFEKITGEFENGLPHGKIHQTTRDYVYVGEFKNGFRDGNGTLSYTSGEKYVGGFMKNMFHGNGTHVLPNGEKYIGEFRDGERYGKGTIIYTNGESYDVEFEDYKDRTVKNKYIPVPISVYREEFKGSYLFFDTETTGLPLNFNAPVSDLNNWPRLVQLAFMFVTNHGNTITVGDYTIKPNGFTIPIEASNIHGITTEKANREGKSISIVLHQFYDLVDKAEFLVAHNISFDEMVVGAEFIRNNMHNVLSEKNKICTMKSTIGFCAIDGPYGYKWPTLSELHKKLFGIGFEDAHDAFADIRATIKCFWELKKLGLLKI